jgi:endoglucanase
MRTLLATFVTGWILFGIAHAQPTSLPPLPEYATLGETSASNLHGVNLGNFLEAPTEGAWTNGRLLQESDFPIIRQAGFSLIRVPIRWAAHVGPAPTYTIDPAFFSRVDWVVAQAEKNGLLAILDYHNDDALMKDPDANGDRFVAIWKQIADHYKDASTLIFFELLNEPFDKLDAPHWNKLLAQTLAVVRATNPTRTVVVGPVRWNDIGELDKLILPDNDKNLLITVHFYEPVHFTHQGAEWAEGSQAWLGTKWGTEADKQAVTKAFDKASRWGIAHHRTMYLGEFGAYSKSPIEGRAQWTAFVARTAETFHMPWTYWEFCSGFGAYDPEAKAWRQPLLEALIPAQK